MSLPRHAHGHAGYAHMGIDGHLTRERENQMNEYGRMPTSQMPVGPTSQMPTADPCLEYYVVCMSTGGLGKANIEVLE